MVIRSWDQSRPPFSFPFTMWRYRNKTVVCESGNGHHMHRCVLMLDSPDSRTIRNKLVLFISHSLYNICYSSPNGRVCVCVCVCAQSCLTLCDPMDCSPPGSSVHRILQARILQWVAISSSRVSSQSRVQTFISCVSCIGRKILYHWAWASPPNGLRQHVFEITRKKSISIH